MKKSIFIVLAVAVALLTACGESKTEKKDASNDESANVENVDSDEPDQPAPVEEKVEESAPKPSIVVEDVKLPSQLKDKVEIVKVSKKVLNNNYPEVTITFKLLSTVDTKPLCSRGGQMWIIGVGQDEDGADVEELLPGYREWRSGDRTGDQFKGFLESDPGETITLSFTGNTSPNVRADLEKVKKFKLKLTKP